MESSHVRGSVWSIRFAGAGHTSWMVLEPRIPVLAFCDPGVNVVAVATWLAAFWLWWSVPLKGQSALWFWESLLVALEPTTSVFWLQAKMMRISPWPQEAQSIVGERQINLVKFNMFLCFFRGMCIMGVCKSQLGAGRTVTSGHRSLPTALPTLNPDYLIT